MHKAYGVSKAPIGLDEKSFEIFKREGRKAGDQAYKMAMRQVQNDFYTQVSNRFGLLRYGPKRLRLTRDEIIKRDHEKRLKQKSAVELAEQEEKAKEQAINIEKAQYNLVKTLNERRSIEEELKNREKAVSAYEKIIKEREENVAFEERKLDDFKKEIKSSLRGWQMPKSNIGESARHYIRRVSGKIMGIIQQALNIIWDYSQKKEKLEKDRAAFEVEKSERTKQETDKILVLEKNYSEKIHGLKAAFKNLERRVLGVKTPKELSTLQSELSSRIFTTNLSR